MTAASGLTAIDMRVQPSWRWSEDEPLPVRAPTLRVCPGTLLGPA